MSEAIFSGKRILLCVTGGIAAYKAAALTSTLVQRGAIVDVAMTEAAEEFVGPLTFAALTGRQVFTSLWDAPETIPHIRLVRDAQVALVAPATADVIAKLAQGIAGDLVTSALLAARIPIVLAPAMNDAMYTDPATQSNLQTLRERGYEIVEPERGYLAERESGIGRLAPEDAILQSLEVVLARAQSLKGKRVLITGGPTREAFDPVRFVSNPSTGATGIALAREAALRGASVTLVLGPTHLPAPHGVHVIDVVSAQDMNDAALVQAKDADLVIATAAVADWRPETASQQKVKKGEGDVDVRMVRTPDVLAAIAEHKNATIVVGFAAETENHETNARAKMERKHLDAIAVNDVSDGRGFGAQANSLTFLWGKDGRCELGAASKEVLAARLLDCIQQNVTRD
ncbi:MAG TPA: bifunctional phosphopantothenoylcysteine decarboxylase/phosphopantothenate--cysteine ligase CoaBC [Candidatus Rubrimentiphilum sp.]|nr:bifunctional phosphopantothenoylcysteine decarboxylase/phosphopantothenate--cysteine ligase CoaBC [Candidatus Rubrimentiphilum sp.]